MVHYYKVRFENSYNSLPETFFKRVKPEKMPNVGLFLFNPSLSETLNLDGDWLQKKEGIEFLSGQNLIKDSQPVALAYAGHQFGSFVPQLGDGRAILLGEIKNKKGQIQDLHLKGSGKTPFSRSGDGRATLGPVLREYIISEYMNSINIPTTRSLAAITTGEKVFREKVLPGAILVRIANSHIRVGTFQYFAARQMTNEIKILTDYIVERNFQSLLSSKRIYEDFLLEVIKTQADLISKWMSVGFIHGVMNTDNTCLSGETIDYGPCAFMDAFDYNKVFSSIDYQGRYSYKNQPNIMLWNLTRFAETILPLIDKDINKSIRKAEEILGEFAIFYENNWISNMCQKLGIENHKKTDKVLIEGFLDLLHKQELDFNNSFYSLSILLKNDKIIKEKSPKNLQILSKIKSSDWYQKWKDRLSLENRDHKDCIKILLKSNPSIIPRNHLVEKILNQVIETNNKKVLTDYLIELTNPKKIRSFDDPFTFSPLPNEEVTQTFCGT
tara:strand:+ start:17 stop:1510 length:1494 start_codon:yes stop_codon:yes gene_type:complete